MNAKIGLLRRKNRGIVIAVDGLAGSGKGTIAQHLSTWLGLPYMDTGLLFRAFAFLALKYKETNPILISHLGKYITVELLRNDLLRSVEVGTLASKISALQTIRNAVLVRERAFATHPDGCVMDGRDIGTVVFPEAQIKFFITAPLEIRAKRRALQLAEQKNNVPFLEVWSEMRERDQRDMNRSVAPLRQALGAIQIDTGLFPSALEGNLFAQEQVSNVLWPKQ